MPPPLPARCNLTRPWPVRLADAACDHLGSWARTIGAQWQRWRDLRRERRELDAAADLSEATLRDMGAPDWLRTQAQTRREAQRFERDLLHIGPRGTDTYRYY